jgi:hypothetical protein
MASRIDFKASLSVRFPKWLPYPQPPPIASPRRFVVFKPHPKTGLKMTVGTHHATRTRTPDFFFDGLENHADLITLQISQGKYQGACVNNINAPKMHVCQIRHAT